MKNDAQHNTSWSEDNDYLQLMPKVELPYSRSKEDVWEQIDNLIDGDEDTPQIQPQSKVIQLKPILMAVAAIFIILLGSATFFSLYTKTVTATAGQHLTALLPDGSSIELNAGSTIKYKPYWWLFERKVKFEGEGFFKVQKGQSFEVVSPMGRTIVLGTSFNIYARNNNYRVTCYTGKVRVVSVVSGQSTDITPNEMATVHMGQVTKLDEVNTSETISWVNGMFKFTATPIHLVFEEIERQYGIKIVTAEKLHYLYSGNFTRKRSAEDVLSMVCRSLGLNYEKKNGIYAVSK